MGTIILLAEILIKYFIRKNICVFLKAFRCNLRGEKSQRNSFSNIELHNFHRRKIDFGPNAILHHNSRGTVATLHDGCRAWALTWVLEKLSFFCKWNKKSLFTYRRCWIQKHAYLYAIKILLSEILPIFTREGNALEGLTYWSLVRCRKKTRQIWMHLCTHERLKFAEQLSKRFESHCSWISVDNSGHDNECKFTTRICSYSLLNVVDKYRFERPPSNRLF